MVRQYPDTLTIFTIEESTKDGNGDWQANGAPTEKSYECRYEANTGNKTTPGADGSKIDYSGTILLKTADVIDFGASFSLLRKNGVVIKGTIKGVEQSQFNSKLWI